MGSPPQISSPCTHLTLDDKANILLGRANSLLPSEEKLAGDKTFEDLRF